MRSLAPASAEEIAARLVGRDPAAPPLLLTGAPPGHPAGREAEAAAGPGAEILSTAALAGIVEHRPRDLTVTARAGLRARDLLAFLEERGQWLPLAGDALAPSVGGLLASGATGPFDASFGPLRRHLLECRVVAPDGSRLRWGRPVMKNVAGYDLPKLLCGSRGRLGVIVEATFRVWPRPAARRRWALAGGPGALGLAARLASATASGPAPDAVVWRWAERDGPGEGRLEVELAGGAAAVEARERALLRWVREAGGTADLLESDAAADVPPARPEDRHRPLDRSIFRLAAGRRYVGDAARALLERPGARVLRLEALPLSGGVRVEVEGPAAPCLRAALDACPPGRVAVERGRPEDLREAEERRPAAERALEARVVRALGGWPRQWLADFL